MRIDLHAHSTVSDGTGPPAQVVREASEAGLDVIALTDHDSVDGWDEAVDAATLHGIVLVPGIEVSCRHHGTSIHLLSYWHRRDDAGVEQMLALTRDARVDRARRIVEALAVDFPVSWDDVVAGTGGVVTVGRPHIADALVATGVVPDRSAAFERLLVHGSPYYVPHYAPPVADAVRTMRAAGGVPVLAHPGAGGRGRVLSERTIERLVDAGLAGLEVDHRDHDERTRERLAVLAGRLGLVRTGSSDYHGTGKPNRLGEHLTEPEQFERLDAART